MAESKTRARLGVRAAAVSLLSVVLLAGVPPLLPGGGAPETVVRAVPVPVAAFADGAHRALARGGGELVALADTRTRPARVCAPIDATGLGVTWRQPTAGAVGLRISKPSGAGWGPPVHLGSEDDADPGTPEASGRRASSFLWTGGSRCVRVAFELDEGVRIGDVEVVFVDSSGDPSPSGSMVGTAQALAGRPRIVTRAGWGADPELMNCTPLVADRVLMGFVHHTAGSNAYSRAQADDVIRGVYAFHTQGRGWCDIGYNFLVDRYGTIYEGRSGGIDVPVIGAAQAGFNTRAFSVSVMGNFETAPVPAAVRSALVRLLAWRLDVAHANPSSRATMVSAGGDTTRYDAGTVVRLRAVSGHRDTGLTACPGDRLYALLPGIRAAVAARGLPKIWQPRLSTEELVAGTPRNLHVRARGSTQLRWSVEVLAPDGSVVDLGRERGRRLHVVWSRSGPPAQPSTPGTYEVRISATGAGGGVARAASVPLEVVVAPAPSPSATPSPSASP